MSEKPRSASVNLPAVLPASLKGKHWWLAMTDGRLVMVRCPEPIGQPKAQLHL